MFYKPKTKEERYPFLCWWQKPRPRAQGFPKGHLEKLRETERLLSVETMSYIEEKQSVNYVFNVETPKY